MPGSLFIDKKADRWSEAFTGAQARNLVGCMAVGVVAGLVLSHVRLNLGMPGHKAIFWIIPIVVARFGFPNRVGATSGAFTAAVTSMMFGGHLAGGWLWVPLVALAGFVIDVAALWISQKQLHWSLAIVLVGLAGMGANFICSIKRMMTPARNIHMFMGLEGQLAATVSYLCFGLAAGIAGAIIAVAGKKVASKLKKDQSAAELGQ